MERLETEPLLGRGLHRFHEGNRNYDGWDSESISTSVTGSGSSVNTSTAASALTASVGSRDGAQFREIEPDERAILQSCVFIEDAIHYRAIHHKVDELSLKWYRRYYSWPTQWTIKFVLFALHMLAFFETPSSLSKTADIRYDAGRIELPCGVTESIEIMCLLLLFADLLAKIYFKGFRQVSKNRWLIAYGIVILFSIADWMATIGMLCSYRMRFRRLLRPFFLLQNSSLMKKTVNSLRRTVGQLFSVLLLLFLHLYFFTLFGMLLFPKESSGSKPATNSTAQDDEYLEYFHDLVESFMNLLILLTTANNPDVTMPAYNVNRFYGIFFIAFLVIGLYCLMNMLTAIIYNQFRGYFSNSMQASLFRRRLAVRAAYEVIRTRKKATRYRSSLDVASNGVPCQYLRRVVEMTKMKPLYKKEILAEVDHYMGSVLSYPQFQELFSVLEVDLRRKYAYQEMPQFRSRVLKVLQHIFASKYFIWFGIFIATANVICITVELATEYEHVRSSSNTYLGIVNLFLIPYYFFEQCVRAWAVGLRRYTNDKGNMLDVIITSSLVVIEGIYMAMYGIPYWGTDHVDDKSIKLWDLVRIINMLILIKLLRVITVQYKAMFIVIGTILDMMKNLKAFAGLLTVAYYFYAILGMILFEGTIKYADILNTTKANNNGTFECGTYEQLEYWSNNFDDFAAALVVLWDVMVVNNWHVFLHAYTRATSKWSVLYFIIWWLISVVIALNLFTALILENFIMRWDKMSAVNSVPAPIVRDVPEGYDGERRQRSESMYDSFRTEYMTVHDMFRDDLQEPTEESLVAELHTHPFLHIRSGSIQHRTPHNQMPVAI